MSEPMQVTRSRRNGKAANQAPPAAPVPVAQEVVRTVELPGGMRIREMIAALEGVLAAAGPGCPDYLVTVRGFPVRAVEHRDRLTEKLQKDAAARAAAGQEPLSEAEWYSMQDLELMSDPFVVAIKI